MRPLPSAEHCSPQSHRMARSPEAASPSSTRTPSPATGADAPLPAIPPLAAFWKALRAAPLSISRSRCAMKYLSTVCGGRQWEGGWEGGWGAGMMDGIGRAGHAWQCSAQACCICAAMLHLAYIALSSALHQATASWHQHNNCTPAAALTRQAHVAVDDLGRVEKHVVAALQDAGLPFCAHRKALGHRQTAGRMAERKEIGRPARAAAPAAASEWRWHQRSIGAAVRDTLPRAANAARPREALTCCRTPRRRVAPHPWLPSCGMSAAPLAATAAGSSAAIWARAG